MGKRANSIRKQARAIKFATLRAQGLSQVEAWRQVTPNWETIKDKSQHEMACQFATDPQVALKVTEVLQNANMAALMSGPRFHALVQDSIEWARERDNPTAVMAGLRVLGSTHGIGSEKILIKDDRPAEMLARIAAIAPGLAAQFAAIIGVDATEQAQEQLDAAAQGQLKH